MQNYYKVAAPELVMLEGDYVPRSLSYEDYLYIKKYHPELLGFWAKLIKGIAKVGARVGRRVGRRIRKKRAKARKKKRRARKAKRARMALERNLAIQRQQQQVAAVARKKAKQKQLLMLALPAAAMLFLLGK